MWIVETIIRSSFINKINYNEDNNKEKKHFQLTMDQSFICSRRNLKSYFFYVLNINEVFLLVLLYALMYTNIVKEKILREKKNEETIMYNKTFCFFFNL